MLMDGDWCRELAARLYARVGEAVDVSFSERCIGDWKPEAQRCHDNADIWAAANKDATVVRGWLVFDFAGNSGGLVSSVVFNAHSVVEENGQLVDITPALASRRYPFLRHDDADGDFEAIKDVLGRLGIEHPVQVTYQ